MADLSLGWYVRKSGFAVDNGPYPWTDLVKFARTGDLVAADLVWHPSWTEWRAVGAVTELASQFPAQPQPAPAMSQTVPVQPQYAPQQATAPHSVPPRTGGKGLMIAAVVVGVVVLLGGGGLAVSRLLSGGTGGGVPGLGTAEVKLPDPALHVQTEWGVVPANQVGISLVEGASRTDAEKYAEEIGGAIVGEVEFIDLYQIEFPATTADDLVAALDTARANDKIALAFPNNQAYSRLEVWGVRQDPYADPMYAGAAGGNYETLGVSKAWTYIKGSGIELGEVNVGVVDDGLYIRGEGAESEFGGKVKIEYPDGEENGKLGGPRIKNGKTNKAGSHGTAVATIIAGDPDNGGPAGIAGPLGEKLTLSVTNQRSGNYGITTTTPDPDDPAKMVLSDGQTYAIGNLVAIQNQVKNGATVINCSWGADLCHPDVAAAYKKFFEKMATEHDDVLFVFAAGNTHQTALDNRTSFPCGHPLDNTLTVAAVDNDGNPASYTTIAGDHYVVDIAATGTNVSVGLDANGGSVEASGTSFASPEVAAAAAMLKAIDPELTAADIKRLLTETARTAIKTGGNEVATPASVGGRVLAIDQAVLKAINQKRVAEGLRELTAEEMESGGFVDAVAITGEPGAYTVKGIIQGAASGSTKLTISVTGGNNSISGKPAQSVSAPGAVSWGVTLPEGKGTIVVTREDNGAASVITLDRDPLVGTWQYPEIWPGIGEGAQPFLTGATITFEVARVGDGYAIAAIQGRRDPEGYTITLQGDAVTIVHEYSGILPGEPGGVSTYSGTLSGDTIAGHETDTYRPVLEWNAIRVK
ncbi:MAG: S8 family serine peptidase [Coriobacteriia bacterium]|nr:S8 family serine peptidase [Coriobacteriia bacterium]